MTPLSEMIEECRREVRMREDVYARRVEAGKMTKQDMTTKIMRMEDIAETLQRLKDNMPLFRELARQKSILAQFPEAQAILDEFPQAEIAGQGDLL